MIPLRKESLKSDNTEEAYDESDKGIPAQAVDNDATTVCILVPFIRDGKVRCKTAFLEPFVFLDIPKYTASLI